jgi:hypothetical protein
MIAWVWDGYPVTGPLPLEQGYWMILAMCIGLFLPLISDDDMLHHLRWLLVGCTSAFGLYSFHGWLGFACGLLLCIFCLSIFPRYLEDLVTSSQSGGWWKLAAGFGFGYLIYDVMELFHTFTVAYAFVPLAAAFRERTDAILLVTMTLISLGFFQPRPSDQPSQSFQHPKRTHSVKVAKILLGVLAFTSVMVMLKRTAFRADIQPYHPENRTFKAGIWTVHFGVDRSVERMDGHRSLSFFSGPLIQSGCNTQLNPDFLNDFHALFFFFFWSPLVECGKPSEELKTL